MQNADHVTIIMVEDDPGHAALIEKNLRRAGLSNPLVKIDNGRVALEYFSRKGEFAGTPLPSSLLVLLDLNLPEADGFQILEAIKGNDAPKPFPSSSSPPRITPRRSSAPTRWVATSMSPSRWNMKASPNPSANWG